ncbi:MAG TPA: cytochrome P450 [Actinocrinis sp.]|jgi:cytochrome P450
MNAKTTATAETAKTAENVAVSIRDLLNENVRLDPYPFYASLHERGRQAVRLGPDERYAAAVFGFQAVDQILRNPVFHTLESGIADRGGTRWRDHLVLSTLQMSLFNAGGEDLLRLRRLFGQVFSPRRVAAMEPAIIRATDRNLDRLAAAGEGGRTVDFMSRFAVPLPADVVGELVGVPQEDRGWFPTRVRTFDAVLELGQRSFRVLEAADGAARELLDYFAGLLATRREEPRDDLVSALAQAHAEDPEQLGEAEMLANLVIFFNAGFRTTANLLGSGLTLLLDRPDELRALRDDPELCPAYVEEMLRYEPPVQFVTRYAAEDTDIEGVPIAKGQAVIILIGAANRDPRQFPAPDAFDPTRTDNRQIAFSAGPHYCLGAALGRTEGRLIIPRLLARFPGISLAGEPHGRRQYFMRGYEQLPVEVPVRLTETALQPHPPH